MSDRGDMERGRARRRLATAIVVSAFVHVVPVAALLSYLIFELEPSRETAGYVEVLPSLRDLDSPEPTEEEQEEDERYDPDEELPQGQVVDAPEAGEARKPEHARFLSDHDQVVEAETRATLRVRGPAAVAPEPRGPSAEPGSVTRPAQRQSPMIASLMLQNRGLRPEERGDEAALQLPPPAMPSPLNLAPSVAVLSDAVRGTGLDYLQDVEDGESTLLSAARWRHAPFFQRVKHAVEQYWHPDRAFAEHDPEGHVYGYRDRETVIRVVLDAEGSLVRAYVVEPSGADFLDDEARGAIRQAAPFPNPPQSLVDDNTRLIVFTFGFIIEMGEQPIFRLRRYGE
jgi:protein TonB